MSAKRSFLFDRWPRFASRHPRRVLSAAVLLLVAFGALFAVAGGTYGGASFSLPGTESQHLVDLLEERFPSTAGDSATVVVRAPAGINDPEVASRIETLLSDLGDLPDVVSVTSPNETPGAVSEDGTIARIGVQYSEQSGDLDRSSIDALLDLVDERSSLDFTVEAGGEVVASGEREAPGTAEFAGGAAAIVILLVAFGSVVAMGVPLVTALIALTSGFFLIGVGASFFSMPSFTPQFAAMIGIGVGIDYSLLIVTRFRESLERGLAVEDAIVRASSTAGRAVLFAGGTVVIALLGLWAVGVPFIGYVGSAASLVVAFAVIAALFVLPAILRLTAKYIDRWRLPGYSGPIHESETGVGYRLSRLVQKAPVLFLLFSLAILLLLSAPVLDLQLGTSDAGNNPTSFSSRRTYDLLAEGFGPGFNGPLLVGFRIEDNAAIDAVERTAAVLSEVEGVDSVTPPRFNEDRSAALLTVIPVTGPQEKETTDLVHRLRDIVDEPFEGSQSEALVGGTTAAFVDVGKKLGDSLPIFLAAVIGLSFLLLMVVFRSVLVPIKAAVMNLLSIGAAYGVLVAVFQWGWLGDVFRVQREGPIESFVPMMLFAVLFGLSMDYEVFLVSRIREEYLKSGDNTESVARGLSVTTRLISAAAAIMIAVFLSFAISDQRVVKEFGMGLAVAIFLDATLVRLVLVPSFMQVMGRANWWFPRWLDRLVPKIGIDADHEVAPAPSEEPLLAPSE